ncbi:MAG TPA: hypothetical protein VM076_05935 [Gemmatimonadaceae bacterium]|nr:hypothetical protein [Gemmatimonadaceae bacterium]
MRKTIPTMLALAALAATGACTRPSTVSSGGDVAIPSTPVNSSTLPTGSVVTVTLDQQIGTKNSKVGDTFSATVSEAITASNGQTVVPAGSKVYGKVTGLQDSNNAGQKAAIRLDFERININGVERPFEANITTTNLETQGADTRNETLKKAGIGAAAGAVLGAVIGGGDVSKILGGAAIGAAAGTVISLGAGEVDAVLPAGSKMTLQTTQQVAF